MCSRLSTRFVFFGRGGGSKSLRRSHCRFAMRGGALAPSASVTLRRDIGVRALTRVRGKKSDSLPPAQVDLLAAQLQQLQELLAASIAQGGAGGAVTRSERAAADTLPVEQEVQEQLVSERGEWKVSRDERAVPSPPACGCREATRCSACYS